MSSADTNKKQQPTELILGKIKLQSDTHAVKHVATNMMRSSKNSAMMTGGTQFAMGNSKLFQIAGYCACVSTSSNRTDPV